jgi:hypothetical protein
MIIFVPLSRTLPGTTSTGFMLLQEMTANPI